MGRLMWSTLGPILLGASRNRVPNWGAPQGGVFGAGGGEQKGGVPCFYLYLGGWQG